MFTTLAEVTVEDLQKFIAVFTTRGAEMRRKHGSQQAQVWHSIEDVSRAYVLIDWSSVEHFERFRSDPDVPTTMKSGGLLAPPRFIPVKRVADLPA